MDTRKIITLAVAVGLAGAIGLTGCSKKEGPKQETAGNQGGTMNAAPQQPLTDSTIVNDLKARLKEKPNDPVILQRLGDAYFDSKQFNESLAYYKKALELKPDDVDIYNDLGLSLHYLGNSAEGLKMVEEGIKKNPYHQRIWLTKGFIMAYGLGDLDGARTAWEKAKTLNPESQIGKAASEFLAQFNKK